ncbi:sulfatase [Prolixibacteraceae bacterium]|nr:sulfatase [Prolixibacteraceae bacterium]
MIKKLCVILAVLTVGSVSAKKETKPNVVIIFADDMGYGDLSCNGNPTIPTPNIDKMAIEGAKFTQFYVGASVCTPSRAALLTGCYPKRVGLEKKVLFPTDTIGLNPKEQTISRQLKDAGYATACVGKWHLGYQKEFMPWNHGFDMFYGFPYSNDMSRREQQILHPKWNYPYTLAFISQRDTLEVDPDQHDITRKLTHKSVEFIQNNRKKPFFLYLAYPMPHIPVYASKAYEGSTRRGTYGDAVAEIDWGVGQIISALKKAKIDKNTIVIFSSDNGPWKVYKTDGGSAGPLHGAKGTLWEGGLRVPGIAYWPGHITPGIRVAPVRSMDMLPSIMSLCNTPMPTNDIDGVDISSYMLDGEEPIEQQPMLYFDKAGMIKGIRVGAFKYLEIDGKRCLFNLEEDISEDYNIISEHQTMAIEMAKKMHMLDKEIVKGRRAPASVDYVMKPIK